MKKHIFFYCGIQTLAAFFFLLSAFTFFKTSSLQEVHTVQNLAGALSASLPEAEPVFLQALGAPSEEQRAAGAKLLARYGYNETEFLAGSLPYHTALSASLCIFTALFLFSLLGGCHYFFSLRRQQKKRETFLASLLERCLSDDYGFLENPEELSALKGSGLTDVFLKLTGKLRLKSEALAEERDHTKTLVTDISHQLKTPLAALKSCFSIYREAETPAEREEFGERCLYQLQKLEHLTASLINISRLENAMICLQPADVSLTDILVDAVDGVYEKAAAKQIAIDTEEFQDITLFLDRKWTAEALFNLLDNAVKYSPTGSLISIRVSALYSFVRVELEDQGIGIPKEEYNNIFKRFYRSQQEIVQKTEGSGIGLYLSRKILEEQGATLSVKAAKRQGSVFVVQLPLP